MLRFAEPSTKIVVLGSLTLTIIVLLEIVNRSMTHMAEDLTILIPLVNLIHTVICVLKIIDVLLIILAVIAHLSLSDASRIRIMVRKGLFAYEYGNPLHLKEGERLPAVRCKSIGLGEYELTISATSCTVEDIENISPSISSSLNKRRYSRYAVTQIDTDVAFNEVRFRIEDVTIDKSLLIHATDELKPKEPTKLIVQKGTHIDLSTSGSMLFCGKTRSGKTTGVISVLLQALLLGRDKYGSEIVIIDPKQAELSRLPHVCTLDANGEARGILDKIKDFAATTVKRQRILNDMSEQKGDAVHWWDAGMHVSFLFIDEYVAMRTMFPKRAGKDDSEYSLATFDGLIKRIVTMGASAGCYVIISIAEASVDEGGLPAMLRSACSTKILFKPTLTEGRFLWDSDKLKDFPARVYHAGDAWFSSTDGIHDFVSYVHFPVMDFKVYKALGELLEKYYESE